VFLYKKINKYIYIYIHTLYQLSGLGQLSIKQKKKYHRSIPETHVITANLALIDWQYFSIDTSNTKAKYL